MKTYPVSVIHVSSIMKDGPDPLQQLFTVTHLPLTGC